MWADGLLSGWNGHSIHTYPSPWTCGTSLTPRYSSATHTGKLGCFFFTAHRGPFGAGVAAPHAELGDAFGVEVVAGAGVRLS